MHHVWYPHMLLTFHHNCGCSGYIRPEDVYVVSVMPCFDKKLEASRSDFYSDLHRTRDIDCVIVSRTFVPPACCGIGPLETVVFVCVCVGLCLCLCVCVSVCLCLCVSVAVCLCLCVCVLSCSPSGFCLFVCFIIFVFVSRCMSMSLWRCSHKPP